MANPRLRSAIIVTSLLVPLLLGGAPAAAATIFLRAQMTGHQEVPANASRAFGNVFFQFDDVTRQLRVTFGIPGGLSGPLLAAHIHGPALPGVNGPIIFTLAAPGTATIATLTPVQATQMLAACSQVSAPLRARKMTSWTFMARSMAPTG